MTDKLVHMDLTQLQTQQIIVALQIERDRFFKTSPVKGRKRTRWIEELIAYTRKQLREAEMPPEGLISQVEKW